MTGAQHIFLLLGLVPTFPSHDVGHIPVGLFQAAADLVHAGRNAASGSSVALVGADCTGLSAVPGLCFF